MHYSFVSQTPEETQRAGSLFAASSAAPIVVCLIGELGVGKTHFVKGLAEGLGLDPDAVTSPTFAIVNEYENGRSDGAGRGLVHMDFYRLESESELEGVGFLDLLSLDAILAIEWGDRFQKALPADHVVVRIAREQAEHQGVNQVDQHVDKPTGIPSRSQFHSETETERDDATRQFQASAAGSVGRALLEAWARALHDVGHEVRVNPSTSV